MEKLRLTPPLLLFCISERFHSVVEAEQALYTKQIEAAKPGRLEAHKEAFAFLIEDRRDATEALPIADPKEVTRAVQIVKRAQKTGQLREDDLPL